MNAITRWVRNEPVIAMAGPVVGALLTYLLARGVIDRDGLDLILAVVGAIAAGGGIASARSRVWPEGKIIQKSNGADRPVAGD